jgi:hypothetical protein
VYVTVHTPDDTRVSERCPALVDSGVAITVIPAEVAEQLSLLKYSEVALADWMDITVTASAYWVNLTSMSCLSMESKLSLPRFSISY